MLISLPTYLLVFVDFKSPIQRRTQRILTPNPNSELTLTANPNRVQPALISKGKGSISDAASIDEYIGPLNTLQLPILRMSWVFNMTIGGQSQVRVESKT